MLLVNLLIAILLNVTERIEMVPYGDMQQWAERHIKESGLIGGKVKTLYALGPAEVIEGNKPYIYGHQGNPWTVSNAYAKVSGIEKASCTTMPELRSPGDYCARLDTKLDGVTVLHMIDLKVMVAGTLFSGRTLEPVSNKGAKDPYNVIDVGSPYTGHPIAFIVDYKADVAQSNDITYAKATAFPKHREGHDCAEMFIYLQRRWEDAEGHIHAERVATGYERIYDTVPEWQNDHRVPIHWGDITGRADYHDYEGLNGHHFKMMNSRGEMVPVVEDGWSNAEPTHMILFFTASRYEAFVGHEGNTLWVDNVRLVYPQ